MRLRVWILKSLGAEIGRDVVLGRGVRVIGASGVKIERGVTIARDATLDGRGGLILRMDALIGFESIILSSTHVSDQIGVPVQSQGMYELPVVIGERVWTGARSIVLPGVSIGADSIIGAAAVVTKNVRKKEVVVGVPARRVRRRE